VEKIAIFTWRTENLRRKKRCRMIQIENSETVRSEMERQAGEDVFCARRSRENLICFGNTQRINVKEGGHGQLVAKYKR
jgi:hypothetical protein